MLFNFQGQGWSETWYHTGSGSISGVSLEPINALLSARNKLTAKAAKLVGWRLTDIANPRVVRTDRTQFSAAGQPPDTPTNAWLATARGVDGRGRRQLWLRGVPDNSIVWNDAQLRFEPQGTFKGNFNAYINLLKGEPWAIRVVKSLKNSTKKALVTGVTESSIENVRLVNSNDQFTNLTVDTPLIVSGFKKPLAYLNGTYQVPKGADFIPSIVDLWQKTSSKKDRESYTGGASVRTQEFEYIRVEGIAIDQPRERRVGRAFFVPAGRR